MRKTNKKAIRCVKVYQYDILVKDLLLHLKIKLKKHSFERIRHISLKINFL
jgi:archaeosine-15-forming tRNA-guanine transglycosylase